MSANGRVLRPEANLTQTGAFLGTPQFAAPEQVRGGGVDLRTDVYAVGATLFCLLAGRGPFAGDAAAVIAQIASDRAPSIDSLRPDVPPSLGRVIARTLKKDPARRYENLAGLRQALLPFATGGVSTADVGRRFAAFMVDRLGMYVLVSLALIVNKMLARAAGYHPVIVSLSDFGQVILVLYFAVAEWLWGRGVGKCLLGLKVVGPDGERPAWWRSGLRALILPGALGLAFVPEVVRYDPWKSRPEQQFVLTGQEAAALFAFGCLATMRRKNGYCGLHELVSGTRVVWPRKEAASRRRKVPALSPIQAADDSMNFGPFRPVGILGVSGGRTVLQARDDLLGRLVWIYRGVSGVTASDARRTISRPTRQHWLQGGEIDGQPWDAFEAVTGCPLTEMADIAGGLSWSESRHWMLQLSEELAVAEHDGTLPNVSSLEQVWIDQNRRMKLLDAPLCRQGTTDIDTVHAAVPASERAVALLREVMTLLTKLQVLSRRVHKLAGDLA
ncbi:MAG: serine/threonine-protein kinase, partial [Pirellulales bacterium]